MMHKTRTWQIKDAGGPFELAYHLTEQTWCTCQGFRQNGYLYLNDATSENGAQEYAVLRESDLAQVESITFSWITEEEARRHIWAITTGGPEQRAWNSGITRDQLQTAEEHGRCPACA